LSSGDYLLVSWRRHVWNNNFISETFLRPFRRATVTAPSIKKPTVPKLYLKAKSIITVKISIIIISTQKFTLEKYYLIRKILLIFFKILKIPINFAFKLSFNKSNLVLNKYIYNALKFEIFKMITVKER